MFAASTQTEPVDRASPAHTTGHDGESDRDGNRASARDAPTFSVKLQLVAGNRAFARAENPASARDAV